MTHLGKIGALASQQILVLGMTLGALAAKRVDIIHKKIRLL
jgi:hypothetical protein